MKTETPAITVPTAVRIQIAAGDMSFGTPIVTLTDGTPIPGVRQVDITIGMEDAARATVETILPEVDVVALADILTTTLPNGKRYRLVPMDSPIPDAEAASITPKGMAVLNVRPGDKLVVTIPNCGRLSVVEEARIREGLERFAPGVPCLVLTGGATLGVMREEKVVRDAEMAG